MGRRLSGVCKKDVEFHLLFSEWRITWLTSTFIPPSSGTERRAETGNKGEMETEHSTLSVSLSRPFPVSLPHPFAF